MIYHDGVDYDHETLQVKICPVCRNEEFSKDAEYCRICGTSLYNYCEGENVTDDFGVLHLLRHRNPSNARFCETCGKPTEFFKQGLLVEYKDYKTAEKDDGYMDVPDIDITDPNDPLYLSPEELSSEKSQTSSENSSGDDEPLPFF